MCSNVFLLIVFCCLVFFLIGPFSVSLVCQHRVDAPLGGGIMPPGVLSQHAVASQKGEEDEGEER